MSNTKSTLQEVEMSKIFNSKTNPRKTFDEGSMKELQESISKVGVLQPILLRKHPTVRTGDKFELVCGERRYRAATLAGLKTIPANIRELTDDEAFEMQIIENLERKDVHPLEEAEAYKKMIDSGKYKIADIAAKFAKPETFIAQRLKFVDLIEPIKKDFYEGKLGIGHAVLIARLGEMNQKDIYQDANSQFHLNGYGTADGIRSKSRGVNNLDYAPFGLADTELFKQAGSCLMCSKRSGANSLLFPDIKEENRCFDSGCYETKMNNFIEQTVAEIINEGKDIQLARNNYSDIPKLIEQLAKQNKVPILKEYDDFRTYGEGKKTKVFYINGSDAGTIKKVILEEAKDINSRTAGTVGNESLEQITKIEERAKRALELDNVKVFQAIKEDPKLFDEYPHDNSPLTELETKAMWYLFDQKVLDYHASYQYKKLVDKPDSYGDLRAFEFFRDTPVEQLKTNQLVRMAIKSQLTTMHEPNYDKCTNSRFYIEIIQEQCPNLVKAKIDAQNEIAQKRIDRTNKKLEELKGELKREDSLETRLEKLVELGFVLDEQKKEIGTGAFSISIETIEKQSAEEFETMYQGFKKQKSKFKK